MEEQDIRVLMMLDAFDIGGTETHVLSLAKVLLSRGVTVFVAGKPGPLEAEFRKLSCTIYNFGNSRKKFEDWVRIHKINVIHAHLESSGNYAAQISKKNNIHMVYTIHGTYYDPSVLRRLINRPLNKPTLISVSLPVRKWLQKHGIKSLLLPNGIDMEEFSAKKSNLRERLNIPMEAKVLLYASRLEFEKYEICKLLLKTCVIDVLKEFPDMHILIAGGGMKADKIDKSINESIRSKQIQYLGNRIDMSALYSISDYVVGTGRVALEAMSCERPLIAVGTKGVFGLVTPDNFKKAIKYYFCDHKRLLPLDEKNMTKAVIEGLRFKHENNYWSKELRKRISKEMEISRVADKICEIYKERVGVAGL
ncbi:glycosyltransferase [Paenibacillus allorhizosphaerae]|uniref:Glycosyltransferase family 4 protein n=1 Tax=Paenibacillus allorhizosphaerae TaxID=2849866 RepID=A0ABN7TS80_9BACL|nr:glycosyltransferase [Paenibacillus allorhizosphaerae]CAG7653631.1 hypothetical protein PAECIP111802_05543 [Paenibacillus allorhizosphaerae]